MRRLARPRRPPTASTAWCAGRASREGRSMCEDTRRSAASWSVRAGRVQGDCEDVRLLSPEARPLFGNCCIDRLRQERSLRIDIPRPPFLGTGGVKHWPDGAEHVIWRAAPFVAPGTTPAPGTRQPPNQVEGGYGLQIVHLRGGRQVIAVPLLLGVAGVLSQRGLAREDRAIARREQCARGRRVSRGAPSRSRRCSP